MNTKFSCMMFTGLVYLGFVLTELGCATNKIIEGVPATDLSGLFVGISRIDTEKITGKAIREFQCSSGTIVTYLYDRGWIGCGAEGLCQSVAELEEITREEQKEPSSVAIHHDFIAHNPSCIEPCQKGHLEVFYNQQNRLIGVRELPTEKDDFCWSHEANEKHLRYPCNWIYDHPRSSSVPKSLIFYIEPEDIPDKICDQFNR